MKKAVAISEIIILILVLLAFTWTRYTPTLSRPFALHLNAMNTIFTCGLTLAVFLNLILLVKFIRTGVMPIAIYQIGVLSFYSLMILKDLWLFYKWNYYVGDFYLATVVLLAPIALGVTLWFLDKKKRTDLPSIDSNPID